MRSLLLSALAAILTAGCSTSPDGDDRDPRPAEDRFDITRPGTAFCDGAVVVTNMIAYRRDDGSLEGCEVELENRWAGALALEIRALWKSGSDQVLTETPWTPLDIPAGDRKVHGADSPDPATRHIKLEVRPRR
ncbi:MAG: hypothetical protein HUU15_10585 [Candidatus Brocadiae bacterium]|nr:hypothetical protein [Candidatus Brocadiia bacterium]